MRLERAAAALFLLAARAQGQCYLEDASATCATCWWTNAAGVTKAKKCPPGSVEMTWDLAPPEKMTAGLVYRTEYKFKINTDVFPIVLHKAKGQDVMVPHSNIHSCVENRGACTPFVDNTPGLSTHTAALIGNLTTTDGRVKIDRFATEMKLTPGFYTVIAHTRFFIPDDGQDSTQSCYPSCLTQVDTAVGLHQREVVEPQLSTSTDAYVGTGVLGGCMLIAGLSVLWGARSGRLDFDAILRELTRDEITITMDIVISIGDMVAFTIGFVEEVLVDNSLKDIVPAAALFLCTGWISCLIISIHKLRMLYEVLLRNRNRSKYLQRQGTKIVHKVSSRADNKTGRCSLEASEGSEDGTSTTSRPSRSQSDLAKVLGNSAAGQDLIFECERAHGDLSCLYMHLAALLFADIPLTAVGIFIIMQSESLEAAVVVALCLSTCLVGAKAYAVTGFAEQSRKAAVMRQKVADFLRKEPRAPGDLPQPMDLRRQFSLRRSLSYDSAGALTFASMGPPDGSNTEASEDVEAGLDVDAPLDVDVRLEV